MPQTSGSAIQKGVTVKKMEEGSPVDRTFVVRRVLLDFCGFQAADIFCTQNFPSGGYIDVIFWIVKQCEHFLEIFEGKGVAEVLTFLGKYVQLEGGITDIVDPFRIWANKQQAKVTLKVDQIGNILHLPSSFKVHKNRSVLSSLKKENGAHRLCSSQSFLPFVTEVLDDSTQGRLDQLTTFLKPLEKNKTPGSNGI
eukprot:g47726.t1